MSATPASLRILVLNAGSSSQKSSLYRIPADVLPEVPLEPVWEGRISWSAPGGAERTVRIGRGDKQTEKLAPGTDRRQGLADLLETLWKGQGAPLSGPQDIDAVGHRVVHGGPEFREPTPVTVAVREAIAKLSPLAPEHNPAAWASMDVVFRLVGEGVPEFAVFDTAFHRTLEPAAQIYPVPAAWTERYELRRYGFHGINHAWCAQRAARLLGRSADDPSLRIVVCHLGNGCSLCAVRGGRSVDTTMGFTPMEGLMMGSRSGTVDPGILLYLLQQGLTADEIDRALNEQSGLHGVSGISEDMRSVQQARDSGDPRAALAFDIYVHRLRQGIGAMAAGIGGLDALVFTAGVGENSAAVRAAACEGLGFLGVQLDTQANAARPGADDGERDIAAAGSAVRVLVIPANEDWAIARECWRLARPGTLAG